MKVRVLVLVLLCAALVLVVSRGSQNPDRLIAEEPSKPLAATVDPVVPVPVSDVEFLRQTPPISDAAFASEEDEAELLAAEVLALAGKESDGKTIIETGVEGEGKDVKEVIDGKELAPIADGGSSGVSLFSGGGGGGAVGGAGFGGGGGVGGRTDLGGMTIEREDSEEDADFLPPIVITRTIIRNVPAPNPGPGPTAIIPEPGSAILGLAILGIAAGSLLRRHRPAASSAQ